MKTEIVGMLGVIPVTPVYAHEIEEFWKDEEIKLAKDATLPIQVELRHEAKRMQSRLSRIVDAYYREIIGIRWHQWYRSRGYVRLQRPSTGHWWSDLLNRVRDDVAYRRRLVHEYTGLIPSHALNSYIKAKGANLFDCIEVWDDNPKDIDPYLVGVLGDKFYLIDCWDEKKPL